MQKSNQIFGADLEGLTEGKARVPQVVESFLSYIELHGVTKVDLFQARDSQYFTERVSSKKKELLKDQVYKERIASIKAIRKRLEKHTDIDHEMDSLGDVHAVTGLLKLFLTQLRDPLLTRRLYHKFILAQENNSILSRIVSFRSLYFALSLPRQALLLRLIQFLLFLVQNASITNLTAGKLAAVFGPILLKDPIEQDTDNLSDTEAVMGVIKTMMEHHDAIFHKTNEEHVTELVEGFEAIKVEMERLGGECHGLQIQCDKEQRGKYRAIMLKMFKMQLVKCFGRWRYVVGQRRKKSQVLSPKHGSESEIRPSSSISELQIQDYQLCWQRKEEATRTIRFEYT